MQAGVIRNFSEQWSLNEAELLELVGEAIGQPLWWPLPCG